MARRSGSAGQLACKLRDRASVDVALVPLLNDGEVRTARFPILAALPAVARKVVGGRSQHIRCAAQEIAAAIAVEVYGVFQIGGWHELGLADLTRPRASHFRWRELTARHDPQRLHQLRTAPVGSPAVISQRCERTDRGELPNIRPVIRFQSPDRDQYLARDAVALFYPCEHRPMLLHHVGAPSDPGRDHPTGEFLEALIEHPLRP